MADSAGEPQTLATDDPPSHPSKRKPDPDCVEELEANRNAKLPKPNSPSSAADELNGSGEEVDRKGKGVIASVDKGKGKMVVEDEDDDSDDSSDESSGDEIGGDEDDSDFDDDPLAEVDLANILPSRARRREPPPPGAYLLPDRYGDDDDDDEDEDEDAEE